jgi:trimeric autotransporter adhesin
MSKNLTRKSLAFGALIALGSSVIAGAPALANDPVTLEPSSGTSYNTLLSENFVLSSYFTAAAKSGSENLKFRIVDADKKVLLASSGLDTQTSATDRASNNALDDNAGTNLTANDGIYVIDGGSTAGPSKNFLVLTPQTSLTASFDVTVQSWMDFDGDNVIDATEAKSTVRTVGFKKAADVTTSVDLTQPIQGDTTATASFKFTNLNNEQLSVSSITELGISVTDANSVALAGISPNGNVIDSFGGTGETELAWDATDLAFEGVSGSFTALTKTGSLRAQVVFEDSNANNAAVATTVTLGDAASKTATARKVSSFAATAVSGGTAAAAGSNSSSVLRNGEFQLKATALDADSNPVANSPVTVTITTGATLSGTSGSVVSLSVNGTVYTDNAKLPGATGVAKVSTTTDAKGVAVVTLKSAGFTASETVTAAFATENFTASKTVASAAESLTGYIVGDRSDIGNGANLETSILSGGNIAVDVALRNQFGGAPADDYDAILEFTANTTARATTAVTAGTGTFKAIVGGKASISIADNGAGAGVDTYTVKYGKRQSAGGYSATTTIDVINVNVVSSTTAGVITFDGVSATAGAFDATVTTQWNVTASQSMSLSDDFGNYDSRAVLGTDPAQSSGATLAGVVNTISATAIKGAPITFTGAGLLFKVYGENVYGLGSLTINTGATGNYAVEVYSNKSGKQTVTLTSGSTTRTAVITYTAADDNSGTALALDAPANILPGRTLVVTGTLTDKYGNAVAVTDNSGSSDADFAVTYDGPGLVVGSLPATTDATGKYTLRVLLGAAEVGSATVTAKYDRNGDEDYTDVTGATPDIVKSAIIQIGAAPVAGATAAIAGSTKRFFVSVDANASAKNVVVKVAGRTFATLKGSSAKKTYTVRAPKGSHKVTVFVGGKLIATKTISVK